MARLSWYGDKHPFKEPLFQDSLGSSTRKVNCYIKFFEEIETSWNRRTGLAVRLSNCHPTTSGYACSELSNVLSWRCGGLLLIRMVCGLHRLGSNSDYRLVTTQRWLQGCDNAGGAALDQTDSVPVGEIDDSIQRIHRTVWRTGTIGRHTVQYCQRFCSVLVCYIRSAFRLRLLLPPSVDLVHRTLDRASKVSTAEPSHCGTVFANILIPLWSFVRQSFIVVTVPKFSLTDSYGQLR